MHSNTNSTYFSHFRSNLGWRPVPKKSVRSPIKSLRSVAHT